MVFYSKQAEYDLDDILEGLLTWQKHLLTREFCMSYLSDIIDVCDSLDSKTFHFEALYETHKCYGKKVYKYPRNKNTIWYIVYDIDFHNNVYINKIMNNYLTIN